MHNGQRDLTEGKIVRPMIAFALPLIAGNMLQTLYNAADSVIVGRFVGSGALAAVGSAYSLMTFLTSLMIGLSMGVSVAFSRLFGNKEYSSLKEAVAVSFVLIALISAAITALAWMLLPQIIRLLSVPEELSGMMGSYMYIILTGLPALFIYNFYASAERSIGNSAAALMMLNGRCSMVLYIGMSSYARKEGLGALFFQSKPWFGMIFAYCAMLVCGWFLAGMRGIVCGAMIAVFSWVWSRMTFRVIGGATGDTIGANEELSELLTLFLLFLEVADF